MLQISCRLIVLLALTLGSYSGSSQNLSISNSELLVSFDSATREFSIFERATGKKIVTSGTLLDKPLNGASLSAVRDGTFGKGQQLQILYDDKAVSALELYPGLSFLLIKTELHNSSATETELAQVTPVRFSVELEKPLDQLRTLGTAGLTAPDKNPGSYLFLTLVDPATRHGLVAGWLTEDRGSGVLFSAVDGGKVSYRARIDYGRLRISAGRSAKVETLAIGIFDDCRIGEEEFAQAIARQYQIKLHPQINGYCTWYSNPHGGAADENSIIQLAEMAARELKPFGFSFIQIDDKWQDGNERNGPARRFYRVKPGGPYPHGLQPVASKLKQLGLTTGIWFLPFAGDWKDPEFKDRQNWFVKKRDGTPFETDWGNTSLDLTQPEVRTYLTGLVKAIRSWGVNYFKMDGLWTGTATEQIYVNDGFRDDHIGNNAPFHDPNKTNIEALRDGLKLLRQAAGPDVFFSGCNLSQNMRSLAGSIGLVDSMRIGPDNGQRWRDYREEISKNASGSIITGPVRGTRLYFMHGRLWWNDPDPCYVRPTIPLNQAQLITSWVAISGQFNLNSDWIPGLPVERVELLKRTMPAHHATARPVDYFDSLMPNTWLVTDTNRSVRRDVLGLFNWESSDQVLGSTAAKAGLDPEKTYYAFDFWADAPAKSFSGEFRFDVPGQSCRVISVRPSEGHPVLVSTSRHATQGIIDVTKEKWSPSSKTLSGTSEIIANDSYQLRIAGLNNSGRSFELSSASVSAPDRAAGVSLTAQPKRPNESGWLRVQIHSSTSRKVKWELRFTALEEKSPQPAAIEMTREQILDHIRGGWTGMLIGGIEGLAHEFKYIQKPRNELPDYAFLPEGARTDDDNDFEWTHLFFMDREGLIKLPYPRLVEIWKANMNTGLWCANEQARKLMDQGLVPPETANPTLNKFAPYNLSGQFCTESYGMISPGMPQTAADIGLHYAKISVSGEPLQAAQFWPALISLTPISDKPLEELLTDCLRAIDPASAQAEAVQGAIECFHKYPNDWKASRQFFHDKWYCPKEQSWNPDARPLKWNDNSTPLNGAMVILALLYGGGDFYKTGQYAMALGYDADCNAATACAVVGTRIGFSAIEKLPGYHMPDHYLNLTRPQLPHESKVSDQTAVMLRLCEKLILDNGGEKIERNDKVIYRIKLQTPRLLEGLSR